MKKYFSEEKLLSTFQSAYTKNHSTGTVLLDITDFVFESFDKGEIVILVLLDYSKAFDCANHELILAKCKALGFQESALQLLSSYLSNRSQKIKIDEDESNWCKLINGVWNIRRELDEKPQALHARMKQLYDNNLLTAYGIEHVDGSLTRDEEMCPNLLNTVILYWLQVLHPDLRDLVTQRFITELRTKRYAAICPAISRSVDSSLDELSGNISVNKAYYSYTP